jgi:hypothetical protein
MKGTMQTILIMLVLTAIGVTWWQFGGAVLAIILGTIGLTALLAIAFILGGRWTVKAIETGARIAVQSSAVNDQHDALKTKALADQFGQAFKLVRANQRSSMTTDFPALPVMDVKAPDKPLLSDGTLDADFTIAGLDDEDEEQHPNANTERE